ncbi:MAG: hypothetical protein WC133_06360 [Candidatus Omnitrophota bacterium]
MKKVLVFALLMAFLMPLMTSQAFAAEETAQNGIVDAGNKLCPISGEPVSGNDFVTYQGKRFGLCCSGCEKMFLAEPEKYLAKMNAQEAASSPKSAEEAGHSDHNM